MSLDVQTVRSIGKDYGLKEIDFNKSQQIISFISPFRSFRVTIYLLSNSILTQIVHPKFGLCQLLRNQISVSTLKQIIKEPEAHAGLSKYTGKVLKAPFGPAVSYENLLGKKMWFVGLKSLRDQLKENWKINKMLDFNVGMEAFIALGIRGHSKYHAWWTNLPKALKATLRKREYEMPSPVFAALGSGERYFVKYENGSFEWVASKGFSKLVKRFPHVYKVAFGADWDSYHILFTDGTQAWNNLPPQLEKILEKRRDTDPDVCDLALCPDDPTFFHVVFADGSWRSHGVPQVMEKQLYYGHVRVRFAGKGQCLLTYNDDADEDADFNSESEGSSESDIDYDNLQDYSDEERYFENDEWVTGK